MSLVSSCPDPVLEMSFYSFVHGKYSYIRLCADIRNWIRNIEQHASDNVNKILVGNKADMDESKRVCPLTLSCTHAIFGCAGTHCAFI